MKLFGKIVISFVLALGVYSGAYAARAGVPMELFLNNPIPALNTPEATKKNEDAVARAGAMHGWVISKNTDGTLNAHLSIRSHSLDLTIKFHNNQYDIVYKDSRNLGYAPNPENPDQPIIHPSVNRWIRNLISDINAQFAALN
ncbi:hypothetical protein [Azonexus sp.]|jgi:hypothetical protein|uniref:hypothetical protein n=1 Tax=Azonexus sp. TaxID=1872668 RepID=UPI002833951C|nr:hypothetical protein [Azonexus sp.]MDR1994322.1 hypothetical protein [Azonexus sp.]